MVRPRRTLVSTLIAGDPRSTETNSSGQVHRVRSRNFLHFAIDMLAQKDYRGTGPTFINVGHKVLYRWTDIQNLLPAQHHLPDRRSPMSVHRCTNYRCRHTLSAHEWPWSAKREGRYGVGTGPSLDVDNMLREEGYSPDRWAKHRR